MYIVGEFAFLNIFVYDGEFTSFTCARSIFITLFFCVECMLCPTKFGPFTWKHHCRLCGFVVCHVHVFQFDHLFRSISLPDPTCLQVSADLAYMWARRDIHSIWCQLYMCDRPELNSLTARDLSHNDLSRFPFWNLFKFKSFMHIVISENPRAKCPSSLKFHQKHQNRRKIPE